MSEVSLYIRIRTTDGKQPYCRPVWLNKKQLKEGWAFVNGKPEHHAEGSYHLRYAVRGKQVWANVGKDSYKALAAREQREWVLNNTDPGATGVGATFWAAYPAKKAEAKQEKPILAEQRDAFLQFKRTTKKKDRTPLDAETIVAYEQQTAEFIKICGRTYADQITGQDLRSYLAALEERGLSRRSVVNYYTSISCFLKFAGIDHKTLLPYQERPEPDDPPVEAYDDATLRAFFAAQTNERCRLFFELLLKTGVREREATTLEFSDLSPTKVIIQARKPHLKFRVKTGKGREIPLEKNLALKLAAWRTKNPTTRLVFGTKTDREDTHFFRTAVEAFNRARLEVPRRPLHRFRDTAATNWLRSRVDLRTVSAWLGHSSITQTEKYISPVQGEEAQQKINSVYATDPTARELTAAVQ